MILSTSRAVSHVKTLLASAARTVTSTGEDAVRLSDAPNGYVFICDLTATATDVGDLLDVFVQTKIGDLWVDVVYFTRMGGTVGAKRYITKVTGDLATAEFEVGTGLVAANVRNLIGDQWRVRYVVTDANANASFTFSVVAIPM